MNIRVKETEWYSGGGVGREEAAMTPELLAVILAQHEHDRPCTCVADLVAEVRRLQARLMDYEARCFSDCMNH